MGQKANVCFNLTCLGGDAPLRTHACKLQATSPFLEVCLKEEGVSLATRACSKEHFSEINVRNRLFNARCYLDKQQYGILHENA